VADEHGNEAPVPASSETSVARPAESAPPQTTQPFEAWAKAKRTERWWVASAAMHAGWAIGREVREADFDAAVRAAKAIEVR